MAEYRLSRRAEFDLLTIYAHNETTFGAYQAEAYHAGFERTFGLIADFPRIGASAEELAPGYRRFRFQSHNIFYSEEESRVLIRAIIHVAMNLRPDLFE
jgi:toxin ParE1/3/4